MSDTTRMCSKHNIACPARCNAWSIPCDDEPGFDDAPSSGDLGPVAAVLWSAIAGGSLWALLGVVLWATVWVFR